MIFRRVTAFMHPATLFCFTLAIVILLAGCATPIPGALPVAAEGLPHLVDQALVLHDMKRLRIGSPESSLEGSMMEPS